VEAPGSAADRDFLLNEILLRPTIIYEDAVRPLLDQAAPIRAMAHITGGGFYENAPRMLSETLSIEFDAAAWRPPELFRRIAERGPVEPREMFSVFNMGVGLMMIVPAADADAVLQRAREAFRPFEAQAHGQTPAVIGRVIPRTNEPVLIRF
jgi:phosphoribosylformylglycinamidine cyclo-ligase